MRAIRFLIVFILLSLLLSGCENSSTIKISPMIRYHAYPGRFSNYRYMRVLFVDKLYSPCTLTDISKSNTLSDSNAAVETSSSRVATTRLIDYPTFMDASGFITTIKNTPTNVAALDSSLAEIWKLAGGTIDITIRETITRGLVPESEVKIVDSPTEEMIPYESLLSHNPDFVILNADNEAHLKLADMLRTYDIPVFVLQVDSFLDYLSTLSIFTEILNTPQNYEEYGSKLLDQVEAVVDTTKVMKETKRVLLLQANQNAVKTDLAKHFVYHMLEDLGALIVTTNDISSPSSDEANKNQEVDLVIDLSQQKNVELFSYLPNQRWVTAYQYLVDLLYGKN